MLAKEVEMVPLEHYLASPPRNGYSPVESSDWTGVQMLGLGCLTPDGFSPRQLKNAPTGIPTNHPAILRDGDLLMSRANTRELVGLTGQYREIGSLCIYPDLMMRLETADNCIPEFLDILLRSPAIRQSLTGISQGTSESMAKISATSVRSLPVPLKSLPEQREIVETLAAFKTLEESSRAELEKNLVLQKGALANHFQKFNKDPREGKESAFTSCGKIIKMTGGSPLAQASQNPAGRYPIVSSGGVSGKGDREITGHSTIVIGRVGEGAGSVFFISGPAWVTDNALWVREIAPGWDPEFLAIYLKWRDLRKIQSRTGQPLVTQSSIKEINIPHFDLAEQQQITRENQAWEEKCDAISLSLRKLRRLRHGIINGLLDKNDRLSIASSVAP
ncbi:MULTISPECIES: restriction endonuclease subunit S [unclassified Streptomyces]|uniref:restriction endonuclease subunit S n=1 Tax=unclassified Streptomyces TaxID=2593676 RepID=UPI000DD596FC|nr:MULTISPECIES: restriction endonuclease subunit S [unclassified Streptomyces]QZZ29252.1 restriction endonuclease subunit S [Streptomyces sp. ST1015]